MSTKTYTAELVIIECCNCHMAFGVTPGFDQQCHVAGSKATFYCPAGHGQAYTQSDVAKLKAQLANANDRLDMARQRAEHAENRAEHAELRRRAQVGQNTKLRRRIAAGVCPCCKRTFQDVARHMTGQHPGYAQEPVDA